MDPSPEMILGSGAQKPVEWMNCSVQARQRRLPSQQWDRYKAEILREFAIGGLPHVMQHMQAKYGFSADQKQYKYRIYKVWKVSKQELRMARYETSASSLSPDASVEDAAATPALTEDSRTGYSKASTTSPVAHVDSFLNLDDQDHDEGMFSVVDDTDATNVDEPQLHNTKPEIPLSFIGFEASKRPISLGSQVSTPALKKHKQDALSFLTTDLDEEHRSEPHKPKTVQHQSMETKFCQNCGCHKYPTLRIPQHQLAHEILAATKYDTLEHHPSQRSAIVVENLKITPTNRNDASPDHESDIGECVLHDLSWEDIRSLQNAADAYTACHIFHLGYKIHHMVWRWLQMNDYDLDFQTSSDDWKLKAMIGCARNARSHEELASVKNMLEKYIFDHSMKEAKALHVLLQMLLAEVNARKGGMDAAVSCRIQACGLLSDRGSLEQILGDEPCLPDLILHSYLLKTCALRQIAGLGPPQNKPWEFALSQKEELVRDTKHIWLRAALPYVDEIRALLAWCRCHLSKQQNIDPLKNIVNATSVPELLLKHRRINVIFGFLLAKTSKPDAQDGGTRSSSVQEAAGCERPRVPTPAICGSDEDMLWAMATVIVNDMDGKEKTLSSPHIFLGRAVDAINAVLCLEPHILLGRVFEAITVETAFEDHSWPETGAEPEPNSMRSARITFLVKNVAARMLEKTSAYITEVIRRSTGVELYDAGDASAGLTLTPAGMEFLGIEKARSTKSSELARKSYSKQQVATRSNLSLVESDTSSLRSSLKEMKLLSENIKSRAARSSRTSTVSKTSELIQRTWREHRGVSFDTMSDSMDRLSISPRSSSRLSRSTSRRDSKASAEGSPLAHTMSL